MKKILKSKLFWLVFITCIMITCVVAAILGTNTIKPEKWRIIDEEYPTVLDVELSGNSVTIAPLQMVNKLGKYNLMWTYPQSIFDLSGFYSAFNEYDSSAVTYFAEGIQYDVFVSNKAKDIGSFTADDILNVCYGEKDLTYKTNYDEESRLFKAESILGVDSMSYVYLCVSYIIPEDTDAETWLEENTTKVAPVGLIRNVVTRFMKDAVDDMLVGIRGFEKVKLNEMSFLSKPGYSYSVTDGILSIVDCDDFHTAVFVTGMNNPYLGNINLKMIQHPDYNNVYLDCEYYKSDAFGYRSFSVMTDVGMYYFKIGEYEDNADAIMTELLDKLGVKPDDEKIELGYDLVLTMEDMIYTDEDYLTEEDITSNTDATVENEDAGKETVPNIQSVPIEQNTEVNTNDGAAISAPTDIAGPSDATNKD